MATALRHFADCVDLSEAQGLPRIAGAQQSDDGALPNLYVRHRRRLSRMRKGLEIAGRIGNRPHKCSPLSRSVSA